MQKEKSSIRFCRTTNVFLGMDWQTSVYLKDMFPQVDIERELGKMKVWLMTEGKHRKGTYAFIIRWLQRAPQTIHKELKPDSTLSFAIEEYLQDLWKENTFLYEFNKIS